MMRLLVLMIVSMAISGCASAQLVSKVYEPSKSGVVKLGKPVNPRHDKMLRDQSNKLMNDFCGGPFMIIEESNGPTGSFSGTAVPIGTGSFFNGSAEEAVFLRFRCST